MSESNTFTLTIPEGTHKDLTAQLAKMKHVDMHGQGHPGRIHHPEGGEIHFEPVPGTNDVTVTVVSNPTNTPLAEIKARLECDVKTLLSLK
jgi:hypothetical protein